MERSYIFLSFSLSLSPSPSPPNKKDTLVLKTSRVITVIDIQPVLLFVINPKHVCNGSSQHKIQYSVGIKTVYKHVNIICIRWTYMLWIQCGIYILDNSISEIIWPGLTTVNMDSESEITFYITHAFVYIYETYTFYNLRSGYEYKNV